MAWADCSTKQKKTEQHRTLQHLEGPGTKRSLRQLQKMKFAYCMWRNLASRDAACACCERAGAPGIDCSCSSQRVLTPASRVVATTAAAALPKSAFCALHTTALALQRTRPVPVTPRCLPLSCGAHCLPWPTGKRRSSALLLNLPGHTGHAAGAGSGLVCTHCQSHCVCCGAKRQMRRPASGG
jgi:hypothetical protein